MLFFKWYVTYITFVNVCYSLFVTCFSFFLIGCLLFVIVDRKFQEWPLNWRSNVLQFKKTNMTICDKYITSVNLLVSYKNYYCIWLNSGVFCSHQTIVTTAEAAYCDHFEQTDYINQLITIPKAALQLH
jgi:hypothetical protein